MAFEVPHKHDISLDGQETRNQMIENFEAIEHEDQQDDQALAKETQDRADADKKLDGRINDANSRMDQLDQEKATHDDVNDLRDELLKKIKHIILGTDEETVKTVIQEMKKEGTI